MCEFDIVDREWILQITTPQLLAGHVVQHRWPCKSINVSMWTEIVFLRSSITRHRKLPRTWKTRGIGTLPINRTLSALLSELRQMLMRCASIFRSICSRIPESQKEIPHLATVLYNERTACDSETANREVPQSLDTCPDGLHFHVSHCSRDHGAQAWCIVCRNPQKEHRNTR